MPEIRELTTEDAEGILEKGGVILDIRRPAIFCDGHIRGAVNVPVDNLGMARIAAILLQIAEIPPENQPPILLLGDSPARVAQAEAVLRQVGVAQIAGTISTGVTQWQEAGKPLEKLERIDAPELNRCLAGAEPPGVLDVREEFEWQGGHIEGAVHIPLGYLPQKYHELDQDASLVVHCEQGVRSVMGASFLRSKGFTRVTDLEGGLSAWKRSQLQTVKEASR